MPYRRHLVADNKVIHFTIYLEDVLMKINCRFILIFITNVSAKHFIFVTSGWYIELSSEVEESFSKARENLGCDVSMHLVLLRDGK